MQADSLPGEPQGKPLHGKEMGEKKETMTDFILLDSKSLQMVTTAMKLKQCGDSSKKLEIEVPYDPAIPLLGIHTKETRTERDTCTPVFTAALFTIARTWKQLDVHRQMNG